MVDSFIIYKTDGVYGMQLIGGQFVMRFYNIFNDVGILGLNCVTAYPGGHFVVSGHDIYVHNGTSKQSVISGVVRDSIYQRISDTYITRSFCVSDYKNKEALFCYVKAGTTATYPNEALVWNWESNTISFRDLPGTAHIAYGLIEEAPEETEQWNPDSQSWDNDTTQWGETAGKPTQRRLLIPDTTGRKFYAEGRGNTDGGTSYRSWVERTGLDGGDPNHQACLPNYSHNERQRKC